MWAILHVKLVWYLRAKNTEIAKGVRNNTVFPTLPLVAKISKDKTFNAEVEMALRDQIEKQLTQLPPEKQNEVLDFILFLRQL